MCRMAELCGKKKSQIFEDFNIEGFNIEDSIEGYLSKKKLVLAHTLTRTM